MKLKNLLPVNSWSQNSTTKVMLIYTIRYLHEILLGIFIHLFILAFFNNFIRVIVVAIKFLFNFRMTATQWIRLLNLVRKLVLTSVVGNKSIGLNSYQQRPKANKGQQRPAKSKTSKLFDSITIQCKIINKLEGNSKKRCF